jgi:hypothetical protein
VDICACVSSAVSSKTSSESVSEGDGIFGITTCDGWGGILGMLGSFICDIESKAGVVWGKRTIEALDDGGEIALAVLDFSCAFGFNDFFSAFLKLSTILPVGFFLEAGLAGRRSGPGATGRRAAALILAILNGLGLYMTVSSL